MTVVLLTHVCFFNVYSYLLFQALGGELQFDLLITPWLTLTLMLWSGPMGARIRWTVRRRLEKGLKPAECLKVVLYLLA